MGPVADMYCKAILTLVVLIFGPGNGSLTLTHLVVVVVVVVVVLVLLVLVVLVVLGLTLFEKKPKAASFLIQISPNFVS